MGVIIKKIKLKNYKRFRDYLIEPNDRMNIIVGDNEVGKSSILDAIDLVASGSVKKVESIGLERLISTDAIEEFKKDIKFENLPVLTIELFLKGDFDHTMNGKNNYLHQSCDGIRLVCSANDDYRNEIIDILKTDPESFPFEYYSIRFSTFSDEGYSGYKKKLKSVLINNMNMNSDYATNEFIQRMYNRYTEEDVKERASHQSKYRQMKNQFCIDNFANINKKLSADKNYSFGLESKQTKLFSQDLMIYENSIAIDNKGTGKQVIIKTDFALERAGENIDVILIEEPENHLSHGNLKKLVKTISETQNGQIFITTHNSLISTRLELDNLLILSDNKVDKPLFLRNLSKDTSDYFLKAPPAGILEFVLSPKVILVEGPSEYILFEKFFKESTGTDLDANDIHVMDIRGLSFKRYLELAKISGSKIAVVTDNDGDFQSKCIDKYKDFNALTNINIFYETDNAFKTFETLLYKSNKILCDNLFSNDALNYMLANKTDSALKILKSDSINVPEYIKRAIEWIRE